MKINVKKKGILLVIICILVVLGILNIDLTGCSSTAKPSQTDKKVVTGSPIYEQFTLESLTEKADTIIQGKVIERGETFLVDFKTTQKIIQHAFTPITIDVTNCLKGNITSPVIYNEMGGETEDTIYETDDIIPLKENDEVLIFMNSKGNSWGSQAVYIIEDNHIQISTHMLPDVNSIKAQEPQYKEIKVEIGEITSMITQNINSSDKSDLPVESSCE